MRAWRAQYLHLPTFIIRRIRSDVACTRVTFGVSSSPIHVASLILRITLNCTAVFLTYLRPVCVKQDAEAASFLHYVAISTIRNFAIDWDGVSDRLRHFFSLRKRKVLRKTRYSTLQIAVSIFSRSQSPFFIPFKTKNQAEKWTIFEYVQFEYASTCGLASVQSSVPERLHVSTWYRS